MDIPNYGILAIWDEDIHVLDLQKHFRYLYDISLTLITRTFFSFLMINRTSGKTLVIHNQNSFGVVENKMKKNIIVILVVQKLF